MAWGDLDASSPWNLKFGLPGYVDQNGNPDVDDNIALPGGATTIRQYQYDKAGYAKLYFKTRKQSGVDIPAKNTQVYFAHNLMSARQDVHLHAARHLGWRRRRRPASPLPVPVGVLHGLRRSCEADAPPTKSIDILTAPTLINIPRGSTQAANVWLPALNVIVRDSSGNLAANVPVKVTDACGTSYTRTTTATGGFADSDLGFPYFVASGTVCAVNGQSLDPPHQRREHRVRSRYHEDPELPGRLDPGEQLLMRRTMQKSAGLRADDGMTLVELLVGISAAMIAILAAYAAMSAATKIQLRTQNRVESAQRGGSAMETITRDIRAQMCVATKTGATSAPQPAMQWASSDGLQFYASVAAQSTTPG